MRKREMLAGTESRLAIHALNYVLFVFGSVAYLFYSNECSNDYSKSKFHTSFFHTFKLRVFSYINIAILTSIFASSKTLTNLKKLGIGLMLKILMSVFILFFI